MSIRPVSVSPEEKHAVLEFFDWADNACNPKNESDSAKELDEFREAGDSHSLRSLRVRKMKHGYHEQA